MRFTIDDYKEHSGPVEVDDIDFEAFRDDPLPPDAIRALRYMHDVEYHTVCYLRDLLVTPAHRDPEVTAFLTIWNYEEMWHGEAIARILDAHGEPSSEPRIDALRRRLRIGDRLAPVTHSLASIAVGKAWTAVHMTWGALNEWTAQAAYGRLSSRTDHPVLRPLLKRLMRQEGKHVDFYATQARERLESSRFARRLTRWTMRNYWGPVGSTIMPRSEVDFVVDYCFGGDEGRKLAQRIDRRMDRLPGLAGLGLAEGTIETYGSAATAAA